MKFFDPDTEGTVPAFLAGFRPICGWNMRFCMARARGEDSPDSDADLALIIAEGEGDWQLVGA
jgi:hypothetical protein